MQDVWTLRLQSLHRHVSVQGHRKVPLPYLLKVLLAELPVSGNDFTLIDWSLMPGISGWPFTFVPTKVSDLSRVRDAQGPTQVVSPTTVDISQPLTHPSLAERSRLNEHIKKAHPRAH
jgi:hypothetical protein